MSRFNKPSRAGEQPLNPLNPANVGQAAKDAIRQALRKQDTRLTIIRPLELSDEGVPSDWLNYQLQVDGLLISGVGTPHNPIARLNMITLQHVYTLPDGQQVSGVYEFQQTKADIWSLHYARTSPNSANDADWTVNAEPKTAQSTEYVVTNHRDAQDTGHPATEQEATDIQVRLKKLADLAGKGLEYNMQADSPADV